MIRKISARAAAVAHSQAYRMLKMPAPHSSLVSGFAVCLQSSRYRLKAEIGAAADTLTLPGTGAPMF